MVIQLLGLKQIGACVPPYRQGVVPGSVLTVPKATSASIRLRVVDEAGDPVDVTGYTIRMTVRDNVGGACGADAPSVLSLTATITPARGVGCCEFTVTPNATRLLEARRFHYTIRATSPGGDVDMIVPPSVFILMEAP